MIRLLIADDHTLVRKGLRQILEEEAAITQVDEACDGGEVYRMIAEHQYELVLLDISLPGRSGIEVLKQIKCMKPELPVLILSMHPEEQYAIRAIQAGAAGYLTKQSAPGELIAAIRKVAKGGRYITASLAERLAVAVENNLGKQLHENLSDREYQVMCMIATGETVSEIGRRLNLSVKTVSTHRARILDKMHMQNNAQLMRYAIKNGLVD